MYRRVPVSEWQKDRNLSPEGVVVRNAGKCDVLLQSDFGIIFSPFFLLCAESKWFFLV